MPSKTSHEPVERAEQEPRPLPRFKQRLDKCLETVLSAIMAILVVNVLWQVISRFALRDASSFTEELARYLLIWVSLFGAAYGVGKRRHLGVDLLLRSLDGNRRRGVLILTDFAVLFFALSVLVVGGGRLVYIALILNQVSPALRIPLGYVYAAVPASGVIILIYSVTFLTEEIRSLFRPGEEEADEGMLDAGNDPVGIAGVE